MTACMKTDQIQTKGKKKPNLPIMFSIDLTKDMKDIEKQVTTMQESISNNEQKATTENNKLKEESKVTIREEETMTKMQTNGKKK